MLCWCFALWNLHISLVKVWDLGGQANLRPSWQTYYKAAHAVIMVVDSTDRARVGIAKVSLHALHFADIACAPAKHGHMVLFLCCDMFGPLPEGLVVACRTSYSACWAMNICQAQHC